MMQFNEFNLSSNFVKINRDKLLEFTKSYPELFRQENININDRRFNSLEDNLNFILLFNSINFCFWGEPTIEVVIEDKKYSRSSAVEKVLFDYFITHEDFRNTFNLSDLSISEFNNVLDFEGLKMKAQRLIFIQETFKILNLKFQGKFINLLKMGDFKADNIISLMVENFPSFNDTALYDGQIIYFYKRAQAVVTQLNRIPNSNMQILNMNKLTCLADYRIPQLLEYLGILSYTVDLKQKITNEILLESNCREEIEIRLASIISINLMQTAILKETPVEISPFEIDFALWNYTRNSKSIDTPHHRTLSVFY